MRIKANTHTGATHAGDTTAHNGATYTRFTRRSSSAHRRSAFLSSAKVIDQQLNYADSNERIVSRKHCFPPTAKIISNFGRNANILVIFCFIFCFVLSTIGNFIIIQSRRFYFFILPRFFNTKFV